MKLANRNEYSKNGLESLAAEWQITENDFAANDNTARTVLVVKGNRKLAHNLKDKPEVMFVTMIDGVIVREVVGLEDGDDLELTDYDNVTEDMIN